jgi:uncharacterized protein
MTNKMTRRQFVRNTAMATAALAAGVSARARIIRAGETPPAGTGKILSYNPDMEYRTLGKTGLVVSAVCMGGHWKRIVKVIGGEEPAGWMTSDINREDFQKNRREVVTRCIERGINYVDACCREEILAYSKALKGRRNEMYFGYSWHIKESRFPEWRSSKMLEQGLDEGMKEAGLDYVDLWRISLLEDSAQHSEGEIEEAMKALEWAKKSGRARFIGISTHNRVQLKRMIERYPDQIEVVLTPYTANTKVVEDEAGLWAAIKKSNVGWFGIKPFASNSLFKGDSSPESPFIEEDNRRARLAIRYILCNESITAPIPGMITTAQVDNIALAVKEHRELDHKEKTELSNAMTCAWNNLPQNYQWLKNWEYV